MEEDPQYEVFKDYQFSLARSQSTDTGIGAGKKVPVEDELSQQHRDAPSLSYEQLFSTLSGPRIKSIVGGLLQIPMATLPICANRDVHRWGRGSYILPVF